MGVLHITKDNFEAEVLQSSVPVMIDFWATWCGPCRMLTPVIEQLGNEVTTAKIGKVNVDEEQDLAMQFGVMSIPTVVVIKDGKEVGRSVGVKPKSALLKMLNV